MAISPLWPKPPRWPVQPGTVDPNQRWVWHTRPRFILPMWEHAGAGAAQRYVRLAQTRRTARTWQLNAGAAAMRTPYGPGVSIPTDNGAEIEALAGSSPSFAAWEQNEPYTIALLLKGRSGGALPKSAGTSFHGRRKPNGSACQRRTIAGVQDEAKHAMSAMSPLKSCEVEKPQPQR